LSSSPPESAAALKARALRLLARREHSRQELSRKLSPHASSPEVLGALLSDLEGRKQLSDQRYAEERARWLARKYGAAKIRHELQARGVAAAIIDRLPPQDDLERARAILARKYRAPAESIQEKAKRARFLHSRGFSGDIIRRLLSAGETG
jgi:regulatory protein